MAILSSEGEAPRQGTLGTSHRNITLDTPQGQEARGFDGGRPLARRRMTLTCLDVMIVPVRWRGCTKSCGLRRSLVYRKYAM